VCCEKTLTTKRQLDGTTPRGEVGTYNICIVFAGVGDLTENEKKI